MEFYFQSLNLGSEDTRVTPLLVCDRREVEAG